MGVPSVSTQQHKVATVFLADLTETLCPEVSAASTCTTTLSAYLSQTIPRRMTFPSTGHIPAGNVLTGRNGDLRTSGPVDETGGTGPTLVAGCCRAESTAERWRLGELAKLGRPHDALKQLVEVARHLLGALARPDVQRLRRTLRLLQGGAFR